MFMNCGIHSRICHFMLVKERMKDILTTLKKQYTIMVLTDTK